MGQVTRLTLRKWAAIAAPETPPPEPWRWVSSEELDAAIARLDPPFAAVLRLHREKVPHAKIARLLNIPTNTVTARLFRGRRRLRQILLEGLPPSAREQAVTGRR